MKAFFKNLFDLILPSRCPYCGKVVEMENTLCSSCFEKIDFISAPYCSICGMPFETEKQIYKTSALICPNCARQKRNTRFNRSAILYDDFSKKAILAFKFQNKCYHAKVFAKWLKLAGNDIFDAGVDLIIPVPLSYRRLFKRGYNQSVLLARELSKLTGIEVDVTSLVKIKNTKAQSSLLGKNRLKNIKNAFAIKNTNKIKNKRIVLIDDVMTTGATLSECAKILIRAGAKSVDTLTVARTKKE